MSKRLSKYMDFLCYFDKSLIVLSVRTGSISIASFTTVIGAPVEVVSASFSLAFSIFTGKLLKATRKKHSKVVMLARSKLNRIESNISNVFINNEISHEDFMTIIAEEKKYQEPKESIRMMNIERSDVEKNSLSEEGIGVNESTKSTKIINKILKL